MTEEVCNDFIEMYEENLVNLLENSEKTEDDPNVRVDAMVDTVIQARRELDPSLTLKLRSLETMKNYKQFLLSEYKLFSVIDKTKIGPIFAEYLLFTMLSDYEVEDHIDFEVFGDELNIAYQQMPAEYQDLKRIFPWGKLIDF